MAGIVAAASRDIYAYELLWNSRPLKAGGHGAYHSSDIAFMFNMLSAEWVDTSVKVGRWGLSPLGWLCPRSEEATAEPLREQVGNNEVWHLPGPAITTLDRSLRRRINYRNRHWKRGAQAVIPAAADVSLKVAPEKLVSIISPRICGKSSLVGAVARLVPFKGVIEIGGKPVDRPDLDEVEAYSSKRRHGDDGGLCDLPDPQDVLLADRAVVLGPQLASKVVEIIEVPFGRPRTSFT
ncbi:hypothetical protein QBC33DRAFT_519830 [Phialemonium atrogriseum]|uniref:ABC transporter domain-containing protein n=1 Tax=Phialemonium atrogriseum TaxID=1093897 RepID=A0AAJ0BPM1_9PEZI|nr:uncharacterized protein QBC33DRAFT_519830 [Phialemonium atrogriseum]KAK1762159.1 hypothetical protein QBC33DRAFT_519830 [Phialemonium atrogriseum]